MGCRLNRVYAERPQGPTTSLAWGLGKAEAQGWRDILHINNSSLAYSYSLVLTSVADCGRSQKCSCRGGSRLGFKLKGGLPGGMGDNVRQWEAMQDHEGRKGVKGLSLVGHEKVPYGFELRTGDHWGHS